MNSPTSRSSRSQLATAKRGRRSPHPAPGGNGTPHESGTSGDLLQDDRPLPDTPHPHAVIPCAGADRRGGLMRQSVMWSVWLGNPFVQRVPPPPPP